MPPATRPLPVSKLTPEYAQQIWIRLPAQIEFSPNTDVGSMTDIGKIGELSPLRHAMQDVRNAAYSAILSQARAAEDGDSSRPISVVMLGTLYPLYEDPHEERDDQALQFEWSPDRHRIRQAAKRFLETDADH